MERLEKYIKQIRGISYSPEDILLTQDKGFLPVLKANNIQEGILQTGNLIYIHKSKIKDQQFIRKGDILIAASSGSKAIVGKSVFFKEDFNGGFGAFCKVIRPNENMYPQFVSLFFKTPTFKRHILKVIQGANINNLRNEDIDSLKIPKFLFQEQIKIATLLGNVEVLIKLRKESIDLLDVFLKSTFLKMFGDLEGDLIQFSKLCIVNPKKSEINSIDKNTIVSFVPMASVSENGEIDLSKERKIENVWAGFTYFQENDVVFAKITPCMENGKGAIMKNLKNNIGFGTTEFHVLRPTPSLSNAAWIYHTTLQNSFRKKAEQSMTGSAGQKRVPTDYFDKYKVVTPPFQLQEKFAEIVEKIDSQKKICQSSLQELENLFSSLSQKAFKGELDLSSMDKVKQTKDISTNKQIESRVETIFLPKKKDTKRKVLL